MMVVWTFSICWAPKFWATVTVAPVPMPLNREIKRFITENPAPTAVRAVSPIKFPATQLSTML